MARQARARSVGSAVRRTVVTPTFAAGLGVVLAAVLAYPMTRTGIRFGHQPPDGGYPCPVKGCLTSGGGGAGGPASARPGLKLGTPKPALHRAKGHGLPGPQSGTGPGGSGTPKPGGRAAVPYQTLRQWQGGVLAKGMIRPAKGSSPSSRKMLLTHPPAHIPGVWGGPWGNEGDHTALVELGNPGGHRGWKGGIRVFVAVTGSPGPPSGCSFDGQACRG